MKKSHKYQKNARIRRNCIECKYYGGMLSKHHYLCTAELYKPIEVDDVLPDYATMDSSVEENATDLHNEE